MDHFRCRTHLSLFFAAPLLASTFGCAGNRVDELQRELSDLRNIQAEHTAGIAELRTELRKLSGKMEEVQHTSIGKTQELEATLKQFSTRVPPPPGVPEDLLNRDESAITAHTGAPADQFRTGLQQIRTGDFEGAVRTFSGFIEANPGTAFTDNAIFWVGVAQEALGHFDRAIGSYSEIFQRYPAEDMTPPALFRLAECFDKMGSAADARLTREKLIEEHPRSAYAEAARSKLRQTPSRRKSGR